ncbi:unnamed protein product [Caenorhabditis sp. 36 PRJEB53466]|nr:unnamed protein product [Caenorhabditis sp. 36 PRJEB53466]
MSSDNCAPEPSMLRAIGTPFRWIKRKVFKERETGSSESPRTTPKPEPTSISQGKQFRLDQFRLVSVLGSGGYGKVLLSEHTPSKAYVALKFVEKSNMLENKEFFGHLKMEQRALRTVAHEKHPFLMNYHGCFQTPDHVIFCLEYCGGGDLWQRLRNGPMKEKDVRFYAACVTLGLQFLHEHGFTHRDLKKENILLDRRGFAKICDFGLCEYRPFAKSVMTFICGTRCYMAPELHKKQPYTRAVDWWAMGILIYEMIFGRAAFGGLNVKESIIYDNVTFPREAYASEAAWFIIRKLLTKNPEDRLGYGERGAEMVKNADFFLDIKWDQLLNRTFWNRVVFESAPDDVRNFDSKYTRRSVYFTAKRQIPESSQHIYRSFVDTLE